MDKVVYALIDPTTNVIRYIGEGLTRRPNQHIRLVKNDKQTSNPRLTSWIKKLLDVNLEPRIQILAKGLSKEAALILEEQLIKQYGRVGFESFGILLNIAEKGKYYNRMGENNPMFGCKMSETAKKQIGDKNRKPKPVGFSETMRKVALARQPMPESTRQKMSEKQKVRFSNAEERKKISNSCRGTKWKKNLFQIIDPQGIEYQVFSINQFIKTHKLSRNLVYKGLKTSACTGLLTGWTFRRLS